MCHHKGTPEMLNRMAALVLSNADALESLKHSCVSSDDVLRWHSSKMTFSFVEMSLLVILRSPLFSSDSTHPLTTMQRKGMYGGTGILGWGSPKLKMS